MPRLKALPPLLRREKPLLRPDDPEKERNRRRYEEQPWRKEYQTRRWQVLRRKCFERDGYICQRTGVLCSGKGNDPNAPVANHKIPHRGNLELFYDLDNLECVSKYAHDLIIQKEEKRRT